MSRPNGLNPLWALSDLAAFSDEVKATMQARGVAFEAGKSRKLKPVDWFTWADRGRLVQVAAAKWCYPAVWRIYCNMPFEHGGNHHVSNAALHRLGLEAGQGEPPWSPITAELTCLGHELRSCVQQAIELAESPGGHGQGYTWSPAAYERWGRKQWRWNGYYAWLFREEGWPEDKGECRRIASSLPGSDIVPYRDAVG